MGNGLGAYAAGMIAGTLTRRYHGLLIAPVEPPLGRWLVFSKADATLLDGDREIPLFSNRWIWLGVSTPKATFIWNRSTCMAGCRCGVTPWASG